MKKAEHHIRMAIGEIRAAKADLGEDGTNGSYVGARLHLINTYLQECKAWLDEKMAEPAPGPAPAVSDNLFGWSTSVAPARIRFDRLRLDGDEDPPF